MLAQLQSTGAVANNLDGCLSSKSLQTVRAVNCVTEAHLGLGWMVLSGDSPGACDAGARKPGGRQMCTFRVLQLSCEAPRAAMASHDSLRAQMCTFQGSRPSKHTTNIQRKDPQEREERMKIVAGEGKKKSEILGRSSGGVRRRGLKPIPQRPACLFEPGPFDFGQFRPVLRIPIKR